MKSFFSFINEAVESGLRDSDYNPDWHEPEWVKTHKPSVCDLLSEPTPAMMVIGAKLVQKTGDSWFQYAPSETVKFLQALQLHLTQVGGDKGMGSVGVGLVRAAANCSSRASWSMTSEKRLWRGKGITLSEAVRLLRGKKHHTSTISGAGYCVGVDEIYTSKYPIQSWSTNSQEAVEFASSARKNAGTWYLPRVTDGMLKKDNPSVWCVMELTDFKSQETLFGEFRGYPVSKSVSRLEEDETVRITNRPVKVRYWFLQEQFEDMLLAGLL
jgi:hypothetical protein